MDRRGLQSPSHPTKHDSEAMLGGPSSFRLQKTPRQWIVTHTEEYVWELESRLNKKTFLLRVVTAESHMARLVGATLSKNCP